MNLHNSDCDEFKYFLRLKDKLCQLNHFFETDKECWTELFYESVFGNLILINVLKKYEYS